MTDRPWQCFTLVVATLLAACSPGADREASAPSRTAWSEMTIVGHDYAFTSPDTVSAGETAITFRNEGTVAHEVKVVALSPDAVTPTVMPLAMIDSGWAAFREPTSGILTAQPGRTTPGRLLVNFESGRTYLLICAFADSDMAPLHSELGMIRVLHVR